jgi:HSP20 family protein
MRDAPMLPVLWSGWGRFQEEMDRLLNWAGETARPRGLAPAYPLVNVWESEEAFTVEAELPGLKQDEVQVAVRNRSEVTIHGERKPDEACRGTWHRRERGFGRFQRSFTLPAPVDADKVEAKLENGVLRLTLPKAEEARPRRITVKAE